MTNQPDEVTLGARLLAEDERQRQVTGRSALPDVHALLDTLAERELAMERQVRAVASWAWCAVALFVFLTGFMRYLSRTDQEVIAELAEPFVLVMLTLAGLALFLAVLMTFVWLNRTRGPSLAVVERRLASLEAALRRER